MESTLLLLPIFLRKILAHKTALSIHKNVGKHNPKSPIKTQIFSKNLYFKCNSKRILKPNFRPKQNATVANDWLSVRQIKTYIKEKKADADQSKRKQNFGLIFDTANSCGVKKNNTFANNVYKKLLF